MTYTTIQGDTWDVIAQAVYGSTSHTGKLLLANPEYSDTFLFSSGVELYVPALDETDVSASVVPPWRT